MSNLAISVKLLVIEWLLMATLSQNKDNTEGSLEFNVKAHKNRFKLNQEQENVLIGTLLGDGSLNKRGRFHRLHVKQSSKQLSLVQYRHKIFSNITTMEIRSFSQKVNDRYYEFCEFVTLTHSEFSRYHKLFYPEKGKVISKTLVSQITSPICLANWFMDDGYAEYAGFAFSTHCFSRREVELLSNTINKNFNFATNLRKNKGKWIIYVPKRNVSVFRNIVQPHILPEFYYKLTPYSMRS